MARDSDDTARFDSDHGDRSLRCHGFAAKDCAAVAPIAFLVQKHAAEKVLPLLSFAVGRADTVGSHKG